MAVLARILRGGVGALMLGAVGVNLANIVGRYVFARPFIWTEEIMQFLDVWATSPSPNPAPARCACASSPPASTPWASGSRRCRSIR
jgi:hypothetical protein